MAWEGSDRRDRLPDDWHVTTARIKKRDGYRCRQKLPSGKRCPRTTKLHVDHIVAGDDDRDANLQTLCEHHHLKKTAAESNAKRWGRKKIKPRDEGPHPGAIR